MTCVALGAIFFSLAVFLEPMAPATGWSRAIWSAMTLNFLTMGLDAFAWGAISDRFGTRVVVLIGALLLALALSLVSCAESLIQFQLTYGVRAHRLIVGAYKEGWSKWRPWSGRWS